jgi:hypothetical protein
VTEREQLIFYEDLVVRLRSRNVVCGITSGMACVHFGIAESTRDCDVLCLPAGFGVLLQLLEETSFEGMACHYRGNLSPPLDERWHRGGWTSHFTWGRGPAEVTLDVFGLALRAVEAWEAELSGLYVSPHIVAQMKRTDRDKDWPFINSLGVTLLESGDVRGWLHLYQTNDVLRFLDIFPCPDEIVSLRPALKLAEKRDKRLAGALSAERKLWEELDRIRIGIYQRALRPYVVAVRRRQTPTSAPLQAQHSARLECAAEHLVPEPLKAYGVQRHIEEARRSLVESALITPAALDWLPDVTEHFRYLEN